MSTINEMEPRREPMIGRINFTELQECPCPKCTAHRKQWAAYAESVAAPGDAHAANAAMPGQFNMPNAFAGLTPEGVERDWLRMQNGSTIRFSEDSRKISGMPDAPVWIDDEEPAPGNWIDQDQAAGPMSRPLRNLVWFLFGAACITGIAVVMEIVAEVVK